jgi:hypothetical protein
MTFNEKQFGDSDLVNVRLGLINAIAAANLKLEGRNDEMKTYETCAREMLEYLANPNSPIHKIRPQILRNYGEDIIMAKETFPSNVSLCCLENLLEHYLILNI